MEKVVSVPCLNYDKEHLRRALEEALAPLGGMEAFIKPGEKVMVKPNLLRASPPERAVTTHPHLVEAVVEMVLDIGAKPFIADSPSLGPWALVVKKTGLLKVSERTGVPLVNLKDPVNLRTPQGFFFRILELAKEVFECDKVINLPKLKTHSMTVMTMAIKNLFGCVPGHRKASWHLKAGMDREFFSTLLLEIALTVKPCLQILDAIWGMEGNGPTSGIPRFIGRILASKDPVALDASVMEAMGHELELLPVLKAAKKRKLLPPYQLIGDPPKIKDFKLPKSTSPSPPVIGRLFRSFFIPKPKLRKELCISCGECEKVCPAKAIKIKGGFPSIEKGLCIRCYCCQEICLQGALYF